MAEELNQMSPINNLPDELLILLFKSFLNIAARSGARDSLVTKPGVSSLLLLTHVCRRWRDLIIGFPAFWTRVDNDNIDRFNEFTRRSRDLPLLLRLTIKEHISDASTIFRAYGQRIRRLTFSFSHMPCNISPLLDCAVPNDLECLIIAYNEESMRYSVPMTRQHLSPHICSSLSALALRPAALWFPAEARFPNLTHLYLSADPRFAFGGVRDRPPLLPLLNKTPKLEFLHIVHPQGLNLDKVGAVNDSGTVVLTKLRSCVLVGGDLDSCFSVISKSSMPQNVWIRLDHIVHDPFLTDLRPLPALPMKDQITHLEVALHGVMHFHLRAEAPTGGVWLNTGVHDVHFNETASWTSWLCSLLETSTFPNLTSLHVDTVDTSTLSPLLQSFPQLTHLGVRLHTLWFDNPLRHGDASKYHEFFHLFGASDGRAESLLLPALESLAFDITHNQIWMEHYGNDADLAGADVIASYPGPETSPEDVPATASRAGKFYFTRPQNIIQRLTHTQRLTVQSFKTCTTLGRTWTLYPSMHSHLPPSSTRFLPAPEPGNL